MKGFYISIKNDLLEPKHCEAMGEAIWLYMWLIDKVTSVNENGIGKVNKGHPVTFEMVVVDLGMSESTYRRWTNRLRDAGYLQTLRTPYGLVFTITKAKKIFGKRSAINDTSKKLKPKGDMSKTTHPDVSKMKSDVSKTVASSVKNDISNNYKSNKSVNNNTNVLEPQAPEKFGKTEINEIFDFWSQEVGYDIASKVQANRRAAYNLIRKYGPEKLTQLIKGVALTHSDQYAPRIADFCDLQSKTTQLIAWGQKKHGTNTIGVVR